MSDFNLEKKEGVDIWIVYINAPGSENVPLAIYKSQDYSHDDIERFWRKSGSVSIRHYSDWNFGRIPKFSESDRR